MCHTWWTCAKVTSSQPEKTLLSIIPQASLYCPQFPSLKGSAAASTAQWPPFQDMQPTDWPVLNTSYLPRSLALRTQRGETQTSGEKYRILRAFLDWALFCVWVWRGTWGGWHGKASRRKDFLSWHLEDECSWAVTRHRVGAPYL